MGLTPGQRNSRPRHYSRCAYTRQMALAKLAAIQTWETIVALKGVGPVSQPAQAQQLG